MGSKFYLECRECHTKYNATLKFVCEGCFGPLDVKYDYSKIKLTRSKLDGRSKSIWRYFELLPIENQTNIVDLGTGYTPLQRSEKLGEALGLRNLYVKNDTVNPTYSFKDRPAGVAVSKALEEGLTAVGCSSTGNLASATAGHAAKAGLDCYVFIPVGLELAKITQALSYGPKIIEVEGTYDDANRLAAQAADSYNIGIVNVNLRPFYVEGSKTLAYEVVEQLGWKTPDHVVVPVGSGALLHAISKGLGELTQIGLIDHVNTRITAAQPTGCAPVIKAFKTGVDDVVPVENPQTIAKSLAIGDPGDGIYALRKVREHGGFAEEANDKEIVEAIRLLARTEGIFAETAGGVSVAVLKKLVEDGKIDRNENVVCYVTGNGLKTPEVLLDILPKPYVIKPEVEKLAPLIKH